jgi:hypothetical protein
MLLGFHIVQYVHYLQRRYSLGSFNLLGHTAPAQAASLLVVGPFLDYWLTNNRVDAYAYTFISTVSCLSVIWFWIVIWGIVTLHWSWLLWTSIILPLAHQRTYRGFKPMLDHYKSKKIATCLMLRQQREFSWLGS